MIKTLPMMNGSMHLTESQMFGSDRSDGEEIAETARNTDSIILYLKTIC